MTPMPDIARWRRTGRWLRYADQLAFWERAAPGMKHKLEREHLYDAQGRAQIAR